MFEECFSGVLKYELYSRRDGQLHFLILLCARHCAAYKAQLVSLMDSQEHFAKCSGRETVFGLKARFSARVMQTRKKSLTCVCVFVCL